MSRRVALERDLVATAVTSVVFALALGVSTFALPLYADHLGYSKTIIGVLAALSALAQMASRLSSPIVMRRLPEVSLVWVAGLLMAASCLSVGLSGALGTFVGAQLLQGGARGAFWTGVQTHAVRKEGRSVGRLAAINLFASAGLVLGPILAGWLGATSLRPVFLLAAVVAVVGIAPALLLERFGPLVEDRHPDAARPALWRRPGPLAGSLASVTAGGWRALLSSYVEVALRRAGESSPLIGLLVSVASAASVVGATAVARLGEERVRVALFTATVLSGAGIALTSALAGSAVLAGATIVVSGVGAGVLQTLGPAVAAEGVAPTERGRAIAIAGAYRAGALFGAPLAVGALLFATPLGPAMAVVGGAMALPAIAFRRRLDQGPGREPVALDAEALPAASPGGEARTEGLEAGAGEVPGGGARRR